ncbi:hypothetical protein BGZ61DRAFT_524057 [Ilyonectria robusta]|uniref:uncharacterized protein n=1 Tax=Ilyonectria robusta TaxID=1079257 RepID=UPI001E8CF55C|nr:uncharacterized protein BGZ61DRAFT_524057 [Ilyonectria robusta]KAH8655944.1 hypothetical protein BGZ61DRAFT_524057 [Ilyonectria robusta]
MKPILDSGRETTLKLAELFQDDWLDQNWHPKILCSQTVNPLPGRDESQMQTADTSNVESSRSGGSQSPEESGPRAGTDVRSDVGSAGSRLELAVSNGTEEGSCDCGSATSESQIKSGGNPAVGVQKPDWFPSRRWMIISSHENPAVPVPWGSEQGW